MAKLFDQAARCPIVVGRDAQLALLSRAIEQVAGGHGQTLLVAGEAGIGKSRLVSEAKAVASRQGWSIVEGHCFEPDRLLPYAPFLDLLRGVLADLSPAEVAELLGDEARDLVRILPELARSLPDLPSVSGIDPAQERRLTIQALATVLLRLSSRRPLLAVIEDLHWSDDTSLDALLHLTRRIAGHSFMLVLTYRDDEVGSELLHVLATVDRERLAVEITLQRLAATEVGAMVSAIVGGARPVRAGSRDALHALTDGNPFFVEEILNVLRWGDDPSAGQDWPDHLALDDLHIPRSVHDAVHRRVERLSPDARQVLQFASVGGRRCDFSLLQMLTGLDEPELLRLLKELIEAQLLVEETEDRVAFRHALTRNAVYTSLLSRERRQLHRASAEAYEQFQIGTGDRHLADLAYHCYEAGDWSRALDYASRAGERAMELYAPQAAIEQFTRALDAAQRLSRSPAPRLYRARGRSYETLGNFEAARADYETASAGARSARDQRAEWQALLDLGLLWAGRDYERSATYCQRALDLARAMADPILLAHSLNRVGNCFSNAARPRDGFALHEEALSIIAPTGDRAGTAATLDLLGITCYLAGNPCDAVGYITAAIEHYRELDDRQGLAWCLSTLALCGGNVQTDAGATPSMTLAVCERHARLAITLTREIGWKPGEVFAQNACATVEIARGQYGQALSLLDSSLALSQEIGHQQWTIAGTNSLATLYLDLLDARQARSCLEQVLQDARAMGSRVWFLATSALLATTSLLDGDVDAAQEVLDAAQLPGVTDACQGARSCWLVNGELCLARGNPHEALRIADELIATDPHLTTERDAPRLARLRGEALVSLGRLGEAEGALRAAVEGAIASGRPEHRWRAQAALGRLLRLQRRHADADAALADARATIDELAATLLDDAARHAFLDRAVRLLPRPRQLTARQSAARAYSGLTEREREVAALVAQGLSNRLIAERLIVSEPTIATHVSHVLAKLGVSSRTQVATWALEAGLLEESTGRTAKDHPS